MSVLLSSKHTGCALQEGDEEYDPAAADDEFAEANGEGPPQEAAEEEEAEFDEAAIEDEERNERRLMAGAPVSCHTTCTIKVVNQIGACADCVVIASQQQSLLAKCQDCKEREASNRPWAVLPASACAERATSMVACRGGWLRKRFHRANRPSPAGVGLESSDEDEAAARSPPAGPADAAPPQPQRTPDSGGRLKRRRDDPAPRANGGLEDADPGKPGWAHAVGCKSLVFGQLCLREAQMEHTIYFANRLPVRRHAICVHMQPGGRNKEYDNYWHVLDAVLVGALYRERCRVSVRLMVIRTPHLLQEDTLEDEGDDAGVGAAKRVRTALLDSDDEDELPAAPPDTVNGAQFLQVL